MAYAQKCIRCGVTFERGIPTLRVMDYQRHECPLCNSCTGDLRLFLKGGVVIPDLNASDVNAQFEQFKLAFIKPNEERLAERRNENE